MAISFALPIFAREKEKVTPFPFAPIPAGPQVASSERFNLWAAHLILDSVILGGASPLLGADPSAIPGAVLQPQSEQVQTSPVQPSDKPKVFGVNPVHVDIHWTAYYVTPVEKTTPGKGHAILVVDRQGNKVRVFLTTSSYGKATMEAVAVGIDKKGRKRYAYRVETDLWYELPAGAAAMGNQVNANMPPQKLLLEPQSPGFAFLDPVR